LGVGKRKRAAKLPPRRAKTARPKRRKPSGLPAQPAADPIEDPISYGAASLHDLFQQQVRSMLDRSDLNEEQKQSVLIAAACPCCGAGGMSISVKIRRRK
jgi:hypothetical protein